MDEKVMAELSAAADQIQADADKAAEAASNDSRLMELAEEYALLTDSINQQEAETKKLKARREELRKIVIPDTMRSLGMVVGNKGSFSFSLGKIHLETRMYASVESGQEEKLFSWLREHGAESMIRASVNASALSAMIRELREAGEADPPHVAVYEETAVKFIGRK